MAQRRFGPTRGAGVVVVEKESQKTIEPAALGVTAYTGVMQKGPVGKAFRCGTKTEFFFRSGRYIPESLLPDSAVDFFDEGSGAGELWCNRVTDGNEKKSQLTSYNRQSVKGSVALFEAGNGGRWAGKKRILIDEIDTVSANLLTLANPPVDLKEDELVGALLRLANVPGKSFKVVSNDEDGNLVFASDVNLDVDEGASAGDLLSLQLTNEGAALGVYITDGTDNPTEEFQVQVYLVEGGIFTRVKTYDNLSMDPTAARYFLKVINDDSDSDFLLKVDDLFTGTVNASVRPANYFSQSNTLTDTILTFNVSQMVVSSVQGASAKSSSEDLGASIIEDVLTLTNTAAGARSDETFTQAGQPADSETISIGGQAFTFKTVLTSPAVDTEILIGADAEETLDNALAVINTFSQTPGSSLYDLIFAEKDDANTLHIYAQTAGVAGDSIALVSSATNWTATAANLSGGVDQTWSVASEKMAFLSPGTLTSGVAYAKLNEFGLGFTLVDSTRNSAKEFAIGDVIRVEIQPLEANALVGGFLLPKASLFREKFEIISNSANSITVKTGSTMLDNAVAGDDFRVEYIQQLGGGYDGIAGISDIHYLNAYDTGTSPLKSLRGKNLGLVRMATPGVTSTAVQKAGAAFAESQNWQYRYEVPANITSEQAAEEYINETIGRNDFAVGAFPSYIKVTNPVGEGLKLVSATGSIHGEEAKFARDFDGYHKAAAGIDAILSKALALPDGLEDKALDEEFLNPVGLQIIKNKEGNFIIWGDRTLGLDPAFRFKHQREYLSHVENTFLENFDFIIFALNNRETREQLKSTFIQYFTPEFAKGAIVGDSLSDAAQIKIDDENNPPSETTAGNLNAEIGLRIVDTVERFIITISKLGVTESTAA